MLTQWIIALSLLAGSAIMLLGAIGVVRMPDLFTRMQTATKPAILGIALLGLAVSLYFANIWVALRAILIFAFFFLTAPVAAHVIARAAYYSGVQLWTESVIDELHGRYDPQTQTLTSPPDETPGPTPS